MDFCKLRKFYLRDIFIKFMKIVTICILFFSLTVVCAFFQLLDLQVLHILKKKKNLKIIFFLYNSLFNQICLNFGSIIKIRENRVINSFCIFLSNFELVKKKFCTGAHVWLYNENQPQLFSSLFLGFRT